MISSAFGDLHEDGAARIKPSVDSHISTLEGECHSLEADTFLCTCCL